jgi:Zn-dependent protease/predicted transcriptional regulator
MTPTIRLGKLFGIEIGFNWSLLFIFALVAWTLAATVLPYDAPGQPALAYWTTGVFGAVVFYACLLAHELSHALVARWRGVKVAGITLWLFGGVSRLEGEPKSAASEALITIAGPLTSFVVAALAYLVALAGAALGFPALITDLLAWLSFLNLGLGLFNMVPAFPLDGGRLLSSLFWWRTGSRQRGVHNAVRVGRVFAYLMIAFGVFQLFTGAALNGIWIAFIGWFLLSAATAEETGVTTKALLKSVAVSAAMTSPVITVPDWYTVEQFLVGVAAQYHFSTYPVHDPAGRLTGVVRLPDLIRIPGPDRSRLRLSECARPLPEMPRTRPDEDLETLLQRVGSLIERRVLVFDGETLVGILSPADLARIVTLRQAIAAPPGAAA